MIQLINKTDVREYRQIGKQINETNFDAHVNEVQRNQLTELLGDALTYDLFDYLENNWIAQAGTFVRNATNILTIEGIDLSAWTSDYGLLINSSVFVSVVSATFDSTDTIIIVSGYDLPDTITSVEYKTENNYLKLLNGTAYIYNNKSVQYFGLRGFLSWHFCVSYLVDGSLKQSDTGNVSLTGDLFQRPSGAQISQARDAYLQNASREQNKIIQYLNTNNSLFPLWEQASEESITNYSIIII